MKQALCATTARLRVPCRVLSWPPILWTKSSRLCEAPAALNYWLARASDVPLCGNFLQTVGRPRLEEELIVLMIIIAFPSRKGRMKKSILFMITTTTLFLVALNCSRGRSVS
jgi:hypothetical protein